MGDFNHIYINSEAFGAIIFSWDEAFYVLPLSVFRKIYNGDGSSTGLDPQIETIYKFCDMEGDELYKLTTKKGDYILTHSDLFEMSCLSCCFSNTIKTGWLKAGTEGLYPSGIIINNTYDIRNPDRIIIHEDTVQFFYDDRVSLYSKLEFNIFFYRSKYIDLTEMKRWEKVTIIKPHFHKQRHIKMADLESETGSTDKISPHGDRTEDKNGMNEDEKGSNEEERHEDNKTEAHEEPEALKIVEERRGVCGDDYVSQLATANKTETPKMIRHTSGGGGGYTKVRIVPEPMRPLHPVS